MRKLSKGKIIKFRNAPVLNFTLLNKEAPKHRDLRILVRTFGDPGLYHELGVTVIDKLGNVVSDMVVGIEEDTGEVRLLSSSRDVLTKEMQEGTIAIYPERTTDLAIKRLD